MVRVIYGRGERFQRIHRELDSYTATALKRQCGLAEMSAKMSLPGSNPRGTVASPATLRRATHRSSVPESPRAMLERSPGLAYAAAIAVGIWLRGALPGSRVWLAVASCGVASAAFARIVMRHRRPRTPSARSVARVVLFVLVGFWRAPPADRRPPREEPAESLEGRLVVVEGTVIEPPIETVEDRNGVRSLTTLFTLVQLHGGGTVRAAVSGRLARIRGGMNVAAEGTLLPPGGPRNPGDMEETAERAAFLSVPHPGCVRILPGPRWPTTATVLGSVRERIHRVVESIYSERMQGFVLAMLLGDRRLLAPDIHDALLFTGTFHLLAISGLHVALVMFFALRVPLPGRVRVPARLLFLVVFTAVTGASPPVVRAALMFTLGLIVERFRRKPRPLNTLGWSAFLLLGIDPHLLKDVGFQLSFVSVASMLTWGARLTPRSLKIPSPLKALLASFAISVGTSAGTAPLILLYFQRAHLLGPIWNLLAYPLTIVPLAGGGLSIGLGLLHPALGAPVAWAVDRASEALLVPLAFGATLPGSSVALPPPPAFAVLASYAILIVSLRDGCRRACLLGGAAAVTLAFGAGLFWPRPPELWTFDVGQGDAGLLCVPGAGSFLIDAGARGSDPQAGVNLTRGVLAAGSRAIAGVFFTHPHSDHVRGFAGLSERLGVSRTWVPPGFELVHAGRMAAAAARASGATVARLSRGSVLEFPGASGLEVEVLYPDSGGVMPLSKSTNDASFALRVTLRGSRLFFLGDLEEDGLAALFTVERDLRADGLLAPHHGRANKLWPDLLERVRPRFVIISGSGDGGARELAAWLETGSVRVFATWRGGAVRTVWKKEGGWTPSYWRAE